MKKLFGLLRCLIGRCPWSSTGSQCLGSERLQTQSCARCGSHRYRQESGQ